MAVSKKTTTVFVLQTKLHAKQRTTHTLVYSECTRIQIETINSISNLRQNKTMVTYFFFSPEIIHFILYFNRYFFWNISLIIYCFFFEIIKIQANYTEDQLAGESLNKIFFHIFIIPRDDCFREHELP